MEATSTQIDAESLLGAAEGLTRMVTHGSDYSGLAGTSEGKEQRDALDESMPDKPAPFLKKLALMLRTNEYSQLVRWDGLNEERGTQMFVVLDAAEFAKSLLPLFFKHNKLSSFVQQLYTYGFRRVDSLDLFRQHSSDTLLSAEQPKRLTFEHEVFLPSDAGVLVSIKRRLKGPPRGSGGPEAAGEVDEGDELEHALLLNDELAALETQIEELHRTQSARQTLDLQRLDSLWHMAQVRLLSQSQWWRGVAVAAKDDPSVCPAEGGASSGAQLLALPVHAAASMQPAAVAVAVRGWAADAERAGASPGVACLPPCGASPQQGAWSTASPQPVAWKPVAWSGWTPPPTCTSWQEASASAPSGLQAPRVDPQLLSALLARAALPEEATAAEAAEAAAAAAAAVAAAASAAEGPLTSRSQGTDLASISLASMASRMASPGQDFGGEEATEKLGSSAGGTGSSSSSANGGEGSGQSVRSRDGSVDGDGSADSSADDSTAEAAAGLRLFGVERSSRPFMQPTSSGSVDS